MSQCLLSHVTIFQLVLQCQEYIFIGKFYYLPIKWCTYNQKMLCIKNLMAFQEQLVHLHRK